MCGRFAVNPKKDFVKRYKLKIKIDPFGANFNVSPGMSVPVIVKDPDNTMKYIKWGFYPFKKEEDKGFFIFNTKAETASQKPFFKHLLSDKRCLIPTIGFYEWEKIGKTKFPFLIRVKSNEVFSLAGICFQDNFNPLSFSIITTEPNGMIAPIHNRMPVILKKEDEEEYLDPKTNIEKIIQLLKPYPEEDMEFHKVSPAVNNPQNNGEDLIKPV